jgi:NitT/TauT family transport system permease protein
MSDSASHGPRPDPQSEIPPDTVVRRKNASAAGGAGGLFTFRQPVSRMAATMLGLLCITLVLGLWWFLTRGPHEERIIGNNALPSPAETFNAEQLSDFFLTVESRQVESSPAETRLGELYRSVVHNRLLRNLYVSLRRVVLGFTLAAAVAIPLGVLCGCFPWINSFFAPVNVFGRNIPIAALIPLTFALFGIGEPQKIMFIFIAAAAFIMMDTASAIADVSSRYIDTAYTLGASRWQIIMKVLVPLAMPRLFNSLRLLFGLAFGYIMLAELVTVGGEAGGLGNIINIAQRRGHRETIMLVLIVIPAVALAIDRLLYRVQRSLFPHQYGGRGLLHELWRGVMHAAEGVKNMIIAPKPLTPEQAGALAVARQRETKPVAS